MLQYHFNALFNAKRMRNKCEFERKKMKNQKNKKDQSDYASHKFFH